MQKKYKIKVGRYGCELKEGTPVVFFHDDKTDLGILYQDKIYSLLHEPYHSDHLKAIPYAENICFGLEEAYVHSIWDYLSTIWHKISNVPVDLNKRYLGTSLLDVDVNEWEDLISVNWDFLTQVDKGQKNAGEIIYRYLAFPYADGQAVYQIVQLCGTMVKICSCKGLGDDYEYPEHGAESVLPLETVKALLRRRDIWD